MIKTIALMMLIMGLWSCSESSSDSEQATNKDSKNPQKHMLSDQEKMIQKAKDVEKQVKQADEKRRKALEDQGG